MNEATHTRPARVVIGEFLQTFGEYCRVHGCPEAATDPQMETWVETLVRHITREGYTFRALTPAEGEIQRLIRVQAAMSRLADNVRNTWLRAATQALQGDSRQLIALVKSAQVPSVNQQRDDAVDELLRLVREQRPRYSIRDLHGMCRELVEFDSEGKDADASIQAAWHQLLWLLDELAIREEREEITF